MQRKNYMSKIFTSLLVILFLFISNLQAGDKIELKWKKFNEGITLAKKENKRILVNVYADWCKWCKKMDTEVFTNDSVGWYLKKNFILVKLNGESEEQVKYKGESLTAVSLARGFGVTGFPSVIFLESNGDAITKVPGFVNAEDFMPIIKFIGDGHYKKMKWEEYLDKYGPKGKVNY